MGPAHGFRFPAALALLPSFATVWQFCANPLVLAESGADAGSWEEVYEAPGRVGVPDFRHAWQGADWSRLSEVIGPHLRSSLGIPDRRILVLGVGDSSLVEEIYDSGIQGITAVDASAAAITRLSGQNHHLRPGIKWLTADVAKLDAENPELFEAGSFDVVLDVGLLDAVCANAPPLPPHVVHPRPEGSTEENLERELPKDGVVAPPPPVAVAVLQQAHRLLRRPGGLYISISSEPPAFRTSLLEAHPQHGWRIGIHRLPRPRNLDPRVAGLDPDMDLASLAIYVSAAVEPVGSTTEAADAADG